MANTPSAAPFETRLSVQLPLDANENRPAVRELSCASLRVIGTIVNARKTSGIICLSLVFSVSLAKIKARDYVVPPVRLFLAVLPFSPQLPELQVP